MVIWPFWPLFLYSKVLNIEKIVFKVLVLQLISYGTVGIETRLFRAALNTGKYQVLLAISVKTSDFGRNK